MLQVNYLTHLTQIKMLVTLRADFGPDSPEYEQAGGTRKSERKKPVRNPKASQ